MSSILISSQSFTEAGAIATRVAALLDYRLVGNDLLLEASTRFQVPQDKLREAFLRGPTIFGMSASVRKRMAAYLQATLSAMLLDDGLVYHGPYAHALVIGVSHILRVRIEAPVDQRRALAARREGLPERKAERRVTAEDERERLVSEILFGKDVTVDGFDLRVEALAGCEEGTARTIAEAMSEKRYAPMTYSRKVMRDVELAHRLRSMLVDLDADASVEVVGGGVDVRAHSVGAKRDKTAGVIEQRLHGIEGIEKMRVQVFDRDLALASRR